MHSALVTRFGTPPAYEQIPTPEVTGSNQLLVDVLAAGLHQRVRSQADGSHYTSTEELPLVPGIDGVGRGSDGVLRYFVLPDTTMGSMADQTVIDVRRSVILDPSVDPVAIAAGMNPAMSAWVALRRRIDFQPGQNVLVLGATGSSGQMAVRIARLFGAGRVIGVGRNPGRLSALASMGATDTIQLDAEGSAESIGRAAGDVDVVIDYLWGEPGAATMAALVTHRPDRGRPLTWIQVGSMAGATAPIPSAALRASRLEIIGSGQGSVSARDYVAELSGLAAAITDGTLGVQSRAVPLAEVEQVWSAPDDGAERIVFVPGR